MWCGKNYNYTQIVSAMTAPRRCAELYGLEILKKSIQDLKFNYTTFIVVEKLKE